MGTENSLLMIDGRCHDPCKDFPCRDSAKKVCKFAPEREPWFYKCVDYNGNTESDDSDDSVEEFAILPTEMNPPILTPTSITQNYKNLISLSKYSVYEGFVRKSNAKELLLSMSIRTVDQIAGVMFLDLGNGIR